MFITLVTLFLILCRNFFDKDDKKALPTEILYQTVNEHDAYSVVITNCGRYLNPKTISAKLYNFTPEGQLKKATKGTGYIGTHADKKHYESKPYGILPKPVMTFCTKQEQYKQLAMEMKAPLNAFKTYINEHPSIIAWHNGNVDDKCNINGFHCHAVIICNTELWCDHSWRTLRGKMEAYGIVVRTQTVRNLLGLLAHLHEHPRLIVGCNNVFLARYAKEGIDNNIKLQENMEEDEKLPPLMPDKDDTNDFLCNMLKWSDETAVSPKKDQEELQYMTVIDLVADKSEKPKGLPTTKTSEKVGILKELCQRYNCFDQSKLLTTLMAESEDDVRQWRILRTSPNFNVIWTTCMEELKSEKVIANKKYGELFIEWAKRNEFEENMSVCETAALWKEWCNFQRIDPIDCIIEMYYVLFECLSKKNTFMVLGQSDAGKTFWTTALVIPDLVGQVITSADFMWQECTGKDLILVPELTLSKYDQVEGFKKVSECLSTMVNVKNKAAVMLPRTPMIVTTNSPPWKFFNDEEQAFKNRMFYHEVKAFDWSNPRPPNPKFFAQMFSSISIFVKDDEQFPYESQDDEGHQALYEALVNQLWKVSVPKVKPGTSLLYIMENKEIKDHVRITPFEDVKEFFFDELKFGDAKGLNMLQHILMYFHCDDQYLYCHWDNQDKLCPNEEKNKDTEFDSKWSVIWAFLDRCLIALKGFDTPICDGMSPIQKAYRKYYVMLKDLFHRCVYLMESSDKIDIRPDSKHGPCPGAPYGASKKLHAERKQLERKRLSDAQTPSTSKRVKIDPVPKVKEDGSLSKEDIKNIAEMMRMGLPHADVQKYIAMCRKQAAAYLSVCGTGDTPPSSPVASRGSSPDLFATPATPPTVIEDESCYGCKNNLPSQTDHMGAGGCLENA